MHWATTSRLVTGKEKSVANGIDSIGSQGILVLLLLLLLTREREIRHKWNCLDYKKKDVMLLNYVAAFVLC